jgi:excinuclease ABC subunit A
VKFNGYSIADILDLQISDALHVLGDLPNIKQKLQTLVDVGLGYIHLGQSATTLSGGEAQRMKLAKELSKRQTGRTLYLLDEPTTGLHFDDVRKLLEVLQKLVDLGNTVLIIEHNLDVIRNADWIMDMGPEGGSGGGTIVAQGTPEQIAKVPESHTGAFLAKLYKERPGSERGPAPAYVAPVVVKTEVANPTKFAPSAEERAARRKAAAKKSAEKSKAKKAAAKSTQRSKTT